MSLYDELADNFVVVNLGAAADSDFPLPLRAKQVVTLLELDAGDVEARSSGSFARKISLNRAVAGTTGTRVFRRRACWGASSLLESRSEVVRAFGLAHLDRVVSTETVTTTTLPEILKEEHLSSVDFLKTDLEGMDFDVIRSCEHLLPNLLALKCELRFQPYFQGEPFFHEVTSYLHQHGFELMNMVPEYWKHRCEHRDEHKDGQLVWADCVFMKRPTELPTDLRNPPSIAIAKLIILASMLGHRSYAEWLSEEHSGLLDGGWQQDLRPYTTPVRRSFWQALNMTVFSRLHPLQLRQRLRALTAHILRRAPRTEEGYGHVLPAAYRTQP